MDLHILFAEVILYQAKSIAAFVVEYKILVRNIIAVDSRRDCPGMNRCRNKSKFIFEQWMEGTFVDSLECHGDTDIGLVVANLFNGLGGISRNDGDSAFGKTLF